MTILGLDYGKKRIGLAISEGEIAKPLPPLFVKSKKDTFEKLSRLITTQKIEKIIFGLPSPDTIGANNFANELKDLTGVKIEFRDETLTSELAKKLIKEKKRAHPQKGGVDSLAAALLLQEAVDEQKSQ